MVEEFVKLDDGRLIPDRRNTTNMDIQQTMLKLVAKFESMENNVEIKLQSVNDKITNMEERMLGKLELKDQKVQGIEAVLDGHLEDEASQLETINAVRAYKEKFEAVVITIKDHARRIAILENAPIKGKAKMVDDFGAILQKTLFTAISGSVISFLGWLLYSYLKTKGG